MSSTNFAVSLSSAQHQSCAALITRLQSAIPKWNAERRGKHSKILSSWAAGNRSEASKKDIEATSDTLSRLKLKCEGLDWGEDVRHCETVEESIPEVKEIPCFTDGGQSVGTQEESEEE